MSWRCGEGKETHEWAVSWILLNVTVRWEKTEQGLSKRFG